MPVLSISSYMYLLNTTRTTRNRLYKLKNKFWILSHFRKQLSTYFLAKHLMFNDFDFCFQCFYGLLRCIFVRTVIGTLEISRWYRAFSCYFLHFFIQRKHFKWKLICYKQNDLSCSWKCHENSVNFVQLHAVVYLLFCFIVFILLLVVYCFINFFISFIIFMSILVWYVYFCDDVTFYRYFCCCSIFVHFNIYCVLLSVLWRCWLGSRKGIPPVKKLSCGVLRGYLSGVRCTLAYGPADATATHCLLLQ